MDPNYSVIIGKHGISNQEINMNKSPSFDLCSKSFAVMTDSALLTGDNICRAPSSDSGLKSVFFCSLDRICLTHPTIVAKVLQTKMI